MTSSFPFTLGSRLSLSSAHLFIANLHISLPSYSVVLKIEIVQWCYKLLIVVFFFFSLFPSLSFYLSLSVSIYFFLCPFSLQIPLFSCPLFSSLLFFPSRSFKPLGSFSSLRQLSAFKLYIKLFTQIYPNNSQILYLCIAQVWYFHKLSFLACFIFIVFLPFVLKC